MADSQASSNRRLLMAYAESSGDLVAPLMAALRAAGFDAQDAPAQADEAIDAARAVIVCWTPAAVASDVVNLQAARARKARKLVPILLAPCRPPSDLGGRFEISDLTGWRGDPSDPQFLRLVHLIHARLSGRILSGEFWRSRYVSWGGASAALLALLAIAVNAGGLKQAFDSVFNPTASEKALSATDAKVDEVLTLLKGRSSKPLDPSTEAVLRESIERLLSAQDGARRNAGEKLEDGDIDGALKELQSAADEGEKAVTRLVETWKEIGALAYAEKTLDALHAYERAAQLDPDDLDSRLQLATLRVRLGHFDLAKEAYVYVTEHAGGDNDWEQAVALVGLGELATTLGQRDQAETYLKEALALHQEMGMKDGEAVAYADLGVLRQQSKDFKGAKDLFQRSLDLFRETKNPVGQSVALQRLGNVALRSGDHSGAEKAYNSALAIGRQSSDLETEAMATAGLADLAAARGDVAGARKLYLEGLEIAHGISAQGDEAYMLAALGELEAGHGDRDEAMRRFQSARELYAMMGLEGDKLDMERQLKALGATPSPEGAEN